MVAAHDVDFPGPGGLGLSGLGHNLLDGIQVGPGGAGGAPEGAEAAVGLTDVGRVDVAVLIEVGRVAVEGLPYLVRQRPETQQVGCAEQDDAVFGREPLAGGHFLGDGPKGLIAPGSSLNHRTILSIPVAARRVKLTNPLM